MAETWKPIVGYEALYWASSNGRIKNRHGRIMRQYITPTGYARIVLKVCGKNHTFFIHRLVAAAFHGERPDGAQVNHLSGIKADNSAANLEYCTASENRKHAFRVGLQSNKGEAHSRAKLNNEMVIEVRRLLSAGHTQTEVARIMNVGQTAISKVNTGKRWGHITTGCDAGNCAAVV